MKHLYIILTCLLVIVSCAKRGTPSGGEKDTTPPEMMSSSPKNFSTNFKGDEIEIVFDEYVKLKDLNKQLIISPPFKNQPLITPQGNASKVLTIKILDTLAENTTYTINFGKSIVDNNEGNPYKYFKYVFSTGSHIDSLTLSGSVKDALNKKADDFVSVMLYEIDSTYTDSIVYKEKPKYITNTLDSTTLFTLENLKKGKYLLMALKEETENYIFNQKSDKIGFLKEYVTVPSDEKYELTLFNEIKNYKALKPKHERKNRIKFRYEGPYEESISIKLLTENLPKDFKSTVTKDINTDTLQYWFKPDLEIDSLNFILENKDYKDSFKVKLRSKIKKDSLQFKVSKSTLTLNEDYVVGANIPIVKIDESKMTLLDKDSIAVPFKITKDELTNQIKFTFDKQPEQKYRVQFLPGSFTDFFGNQNDTLKYGATTKKLSAYGNMTLKVGNLPKYPVIVQLVTDKGKVKYERFGNNISSFIFNNIDPATYYLRVIHDVNGNQIFDTGNFLKKLQPEKVSYYPDAIEVRGNWDIDQQFTLK